LIFHIFDIREILQLHSVPGPQHQVEIGQRFSACLAFQSFNAEYCTPLFPDCATGKE